MSKAKERAKKRLVANIDALAANVEYEREIRAETLKKVREIINTELGRASPERKRILGKLKELEK